MSVSYKTKGWAWHGWQQLPISIGNTVCLCRNSLILMESITVLAQKQTVLKHTNQIVHIHNSLPPRKIVAMRLCWQEPQSSKFVVITLKQTHWGINDYKQSLSKNMNQSNDWLTFACFEPLGDLGKRQWNASSRDRLRLKSFLKNEQPERLTLIKRLVLAHVQPWVGEEHLSGGLARTSR